MLRGTTITTDGAPMTFRPNSPALLAGALLLAACAINPATGRRELMMVSQEQEAAMGREYDPQIVASMGLYPDTALQRYVAALGQRLAAQSERPNLQWTFRVIDDPVVNAFAVPGGYIYITRGIMAHFNSEAQLAAVIGHEIGHVTARHSAAQMSRQQIAQLGLVVGSMASEQIAQNAQAASAGLGMLFLKYGRDDENEADALGLRYMRRTSYDVREMPGVFTMLGSISAASGAEPVPNWMSSHPAPADREQRMQTAIARIPADSVGTIVERDSYLRRLNNVVYGENPRSGYFIGQRFKHPDLKFTLTFPDGWTTQNETQAVRAISAAKDALIQMTLSKAPTPDSAMRAFGARQGMQLGAVQRPGVTGFTSSMAPFGAVAGADTVRGAAMFIQHGGLVFELLAYGPAAKWSSQREVAERTLRSFAVLTEPAALAVQPQRLQIVRLDRQTSIEGLLRQRPSPLTAAQLGLLNQIGISDVLSAGTSVKWVTGAVPP
jgi:predicted Zn-dependent protease